MNLRIGSFAVAALLLASCGEPDDAAPQGDGTSRPANAASRTDAGLPNPDVAQPVPDWPPASRPPSSAAPARDASPPDALSDMLPRADDAPPEIVPDSVLIDEPEPVPDEPM